MKAWKVTINSMSIIYSLNKNHITHKEHDNNLFYLKYSLNNRTVSNLGKIYIFKELHNLCNWIESSRIEPFVYDLIIFYGEAENVGCPKFISRNLSPVLIESFWNIKKNKKRNGFFNANGSSSCYCPFGTFTCSAFTPLKKYTYNEALKIKDK